MSLIRFDDVRRWMFDAALPFWSTVGVDGPGLGFVEHLTLDGRPANPPYKRMRVQARQVYVFSHAHLMGVPGALDAAENGWRFMLAHGRKSDGGWVRRMGRQGGVVDPTPDFYDYAFVLFAQAWWARASGERAPIELALETLDALDRDLSRADGRGWRSAADDDPAGEAIQNPHMHLFEALVALYETSREPVFRDRALSVGRLFETTFFDPATGTLAEYYDKDWRRAPGQRGRIVEPGHQFEWAWLLHHASTQLGADFRVAARGLFDFAECRGVDPETGMTWDEVLDDGTPLSRGTRSWPQTEAIKAHMARFEFDGALDEARVARIVSNTLDRFLAVEPRGTWIDWFDADGRPKVDKIPASTLYHVFLAFAELLRLEPAIRARS